MLTSCVVASLTQSVMWTWKSLFCKSSRGITPRAESAVGEETSSLDVGEPYDNDLLGPGSSRVMQILYEEREEKRRLLNLMRKAAAHA